MTRTCVLYARVSNKSQADRGLSLPGQFRELRAWAAQEGFRVVEEVSDTGGKDSKRDVLDRPGVNRVLDLCESRRVDAVIAQSRDRFGEYPIPDMLATQLARYGTKLRTPADSGEGDAAELLNAFSDLMARRERRTTASRSRSRKLEHVRNGYVMASHTPPYGFAFAGLKERRTLEVRPEHMEVVARIFRLIGVEGEGVRGVKRILDAEAVPTPPNPLKDKHPEKGRFWSRQFIRDAIGADVYKTHTREELAALVADGFMTPQVADTAPDPCCVWWYEGKDYEGNTRRVAVPIADAGIPREWVDAARAALRDNVSSRSKHRAFWELRGVLYCADCGNRLQSHSTTRRPTKTYHYYECAAFRDYGNGACQRRVRLRAETAEETVWSFVSGLLSDPACIVEGIDKRIEQERLRLRTDPEREQMALLEKRGALDDERRGYLRQNARGVIGDAELDEMLAGLEEARQQIDRSLELLRERGERLRRLEMLRELYAGILFTNAFAEQIPAAEELYGKEHVATAIDVLHAGHIEYAQARHRRMLDTYGPEDRHACYREMEIRVVAHSKEELEISGVFGTEFVLVGAGSSWPRSTPTMHLPPSHALPTWG